MPLPQSLSRILPGEVEYTPPVLALLATNLLTIIVAVTEGWDLATVLFSYWAQSIIIGVFAVASILTCDRAALAADLGRPDPGGERKAEWTDRGTLAYLGVMAGFFCLHYGLFHWGYYAFIVESGLFGPVDFSNPGLQASCGLFFVNHLYSFLWHRPRERQGAQYVTGAFFRPYNRIIPMHLTILFGSIVVLALAFLNLPGEMVVLVLFLLLKTYLDLRMHLRKHYEEQHPDEPVRFIAL